MTPRERFEVLLAELRRVGAEEAAFADPDHPRNARMIRDLAEAVHTAGYVSPAVAISATATRKRKKGEVASVAMIEQILRTVRKLEGMSDGVQEAWKVALAPHEAERSGAFAGFTFRRAELEAELSSLAPLVKIEHADEPRYVKSVHVTGYHSTGNAATYARGEAQRAALRMASTGARVEAAVDDASDRYPTWTIRAWVAEELDVEVVRRLRLTAREEVRLCWKLGVNPRVYNPFLPHGFEEREGLDYFGNDLRAEREAAGAASTARIAAAADERMRCERALALTWDVRASSLHLVDPGKLGTWEAESRGGLRIELLPLPGLVALSWRGTDGAQLSQAVYDVTGSPVAGPVYSGTSVCDWGPPARRAGLIDVDQAPRPARRRVSLAAR